MNPISRNKLLALGLTALVLVGGGCLTAASLSEQKRDEASTSATALVKNLTVFDVDKWTEHKGKYRIVSSGGTYQGLVKDCHFSFRFPEAQMSYDVFFGMDEPARVTDYCDARFFVTGEKGVNAASELFLNYFPKDEAGQLVDRIAGFEQDLKNISSSTPVRIQEKAIYVDGRRAIQVIYDYENSAIREPYNQRRTLMTWIEDINGVLEDRWDGYAGQEDLYQAILSTIRFY